VAGSSNPPETQAGSNPTEPPASAAVLIETRHGHALNYVLQQADQFLPPDFSIVLLTNANVASLFNNTSNREIVVKVVLNATLDRHGYNKLLKTRSLYTDILQAYDRLLFFQTDTVFCRSLDDDEWDTLHNDIGYVGAVWDESVTQKGFACAALRDRSLPRAYVRVGNGGFSYRSKETMLEVFDRWDQKSGHLDFNEDVWFACGAHYLGALAPENLANRFCIESVPFDDEMAAFTSYMGGAPFGVHKPWAYQHEKNLQRLIEACPPLQGLIDVQSIDTVKEGVEEEEAESKKAEVVHVEEERDQQQEEEKEEEEEEEEEAEDVGTAANTRRVESL
jgi:hypothetical protein